MIGVLCWQVVFDESSRFDDHIVEPVEVVFCRVLARTEVRPSL